MWCKTRDRSLTSRRGSSGMRPPTRRSSRRVGSHDILPRADRAERCDDFVAGLCCYRFPSASSKYAATSMRSVSRAPSRRRPVRGLRGSSGPTPAVAGREPGPRRGRRGDVAAGISRRTRGFAMPQRRSRSASVNALTSRSRPLLSASLTRRHSSQDAGRRPRPERRGEPLPARRYTESVRRRAVFDPSSALIDR